MSSGVTREGRMCVSPSRPAPAVQNRQYGLPQVARWEKERWWWQWEERWRGIACRDASETPRRGSFRYAAVRQR